MIFYAGTFTFRGLFCSDMFPLEREMMKNDEKRVKAGPLLQVPGVESLGTSRHKSK